MFLETEKKRINNPSEKQIIKAIESVKGSFVILEEENGNYIQAGGGINDEYTVEVRTYSDEVNFTHLKAYNAKSESNDERIIIIAGSSVKVLEKEILDSKTVKELFQEFYIGKYQSEIVGWSDMTSMFLDD
jgi:hypothetical protein